MSVKDQYSAEEWDAIGQSPFFVSAAIGMSDPSGPFGMMKEGMALAREVKEAMDGQHGELAKAVAAEIRDHRPSRKELIGDAKNADEAEEYAMAKLASIAALADKAGADGSQLLAWLNSAAQSIAEAGKEGGFLGIGGESVSSGEQAALGKIRVALGQ